MLTQSLFDEGPPPPCPTPFNLAQYVLSAGRATPDKPALRILSPSGDAVWTYGDLIRAIAGVAAGLQALGLAQGAPILLRIGNDIDFPLAFLGAIWGGFVPVPTSSQLTSAEVSTLIGDLQPALIVSGRGMAGPDDFTGLHLGADGLSDMRQSPAVPAVMGDPDRLAYIIYTSGTSGRPRAVMHAHRAVWARRMMWQDWYGLGVDDRMLHAGAFNWTYTLGTGLLDPWAIGATALIPAAGLNPAELAAMLNKSCATIFAAAPGVFRQVLNSGAPLSAPDLRHALSAGEKLPSGLAEAWRRATGTAIYEALGMSEVSTFISARPGAILPAGATGRPQCGRRVAVLDPATLTPTRPGAEGILAVSSRDPGLMLGYRNQPEETKQKFSGEWFLTGDTVTMDGDGFVRYLGRNDDMMNAGGYRVSPLEVEAVLNAHPDIHEAAAAVVEIKPDVFVIAAFYTSDIDLAESALAAYAAERLARYKCPRLFRRLAELPKGANNKLRRGELRQRLEGRI